jgi:hypothetical protein
MEGMYNHKCKAPVEVENFLAETAPASDVATINAVVIN